MTSMDPYSSNAFRVLGVGANSSAKEVGRAADRLLKWMELGEIAEALDLLPYLGLLRRDREQVKNAAKEIEDPRTRIKSELYWPSSDFSGFETCQKFLTTGRYAEFVSYCKKAVADGFAGRRNLKNAEPRLDACLGCHFLAIFYHSGAIVDARGSRTTTSSEKLPADWDHAFQYWALAIKDEFFWTHLANRARLLNDPRVSTSYVQELRQQLPLTLLRVNVSRAIAGVNRDRFDDLVQNCRIIRKAQMGSEGDRALTEVALALQERFEKSLHEIQSSVSESAIRMQVPRAALSNSEGTETGLDPEKLTRYLAAVEESVNKKLAPTGRRIREAGLDHTEPACEILDGVAYAYRSVSLAFNNYGGMPHASLRLTAAAKEFAHGTQCRQRLDEDYQVLQFLSLQKDAAELAGASRYKESLAKLQEARQFAGSDEERRTVDEWVEVAQKRIVLEGVKQIDSAPSMFTFNGIGTMLYGKRNYDSHSQSYVATLYFTFLFLPILPMSAYRVRNVGGSQYQFLGKVPLKATAFIGPAIVAVVLGFFMIQDHMETSTSRSMQSAPSHSVGTITSRQASSMDKDNLGQWIDQERARLKSEEADIDSEGTQIDIERQSLDQKANELNGGSPSQAEIDSYESDRLRFNRRVQAYNTQLGRYRTDLRGFNAQVNRYNSMP